MKDLNEYNVINLTPHPITVRVRGESHTYLPKGVCRVSVLTGLPLGDEDRVFYSSPTYGLLEGLPAEQRDDTIYIVSSMVLPHIPRNRYDVFAPGTGPSDNPIRDEKGHIIAVTRLVRSV